MNTITPSIVAFSVSLCALGLAAHDAHADAEATIEQKTAEAMENFDLLEFEEAKKLLTEGLALAKKNKLKNGLVADVYVKLGVVYFSGFEDRENAKLQFIEAVQIDADVAIAAAYRTTQMAKMLSAVKKRYGNESGADGGDPVDAGDGDGDGDCSSAEGFVHELVEEAAGGRPIKLSAQVGPDVKADSVVLFFRPKGATKFSQAKMKRRGDCDYRGEIPAKALTGDVVHYYVAAVSAEGKKVANRGSSGSPNIIEIQAQASGSSFGDVDEENPLGGSSGAASASESDSETSGVKKKVGPIGRGGSPKLFLSISVGSGGGYVNGETEQVKSPVGCCVAPALLHAFPELGYFLSDQLAIGLAFRMGFPLGANRPGHATAAPAGMLRVHYSLSPGGALSVTGAVGAGLIRHTVKIEDQPPAMNVDTTASGPVLLGAGVNFQRALSGPMKFVAELNALSALGGFKFAGVEPGFALQFDANLGIRFAF